MKLTNVIQVRPVTNVNGILNPSNSTELKMAAPFTGRAA